MSDIVIKIIIVILGIFLGSYFNYVGSKLSHRSGYKHTNCNNCGNRISPLCPSILLYFINFGRCKKCNQKISIIPCIFELFCSITFLLCYNVYKDVYPELLTLFFSFLFISSLLIVFISDIKYMIIPDQVLIFFGVILALIKVAIGYFNEEYESLIDAGYELFFLLYNGAFMFFILYFIKAIGDYFGKKDTMGYGDVKMMFFVSMFLGWKISCFVVFFAAFLSLPACSIAMLRNSKQTMIAFGPYLAMSTIIFYLLKIDLNTILEYIK